MITATYPHFRNIGRVYRWAIGYAEKCFCSNSGLSSRVANSNPTAKDLGLSDWQ